MGRSGTTPSLLEGGLLHSLKLGKVLFVLVRAVVGGPAPGGARNLSGLSWARLACSALLDKPHNRSRESGGRPRLNRGGNKTAAPAILIAGAAALCFGLPAYSTSLIALAAHSSMHCPQSTQVSGSITYLGSPSVIASVGQLSRHVPHLVHSSEITCAIVYSFLVSAATAYPGLGRRDQLRPIRPDRPRNLATGPGTHN